MQGLIGRGGKDHVVIDHDERSEIRAEGDQDDPGGAEDGVVGPQQDHAGNDKHERHQQRECASLQGEFGQAFIGADDAPGLLG